MVTHDLREARLLADRLCILEGGATLQDGPPENVLSRPRNAHVAALVGLRDIHSGVFHRSPDGGSGARLRWGDEQGIDLLTVDKGRIDDGTTVEQTFSEQPAMQRLTVPPVETSTISITITSVTPPGSGNLGRDYTAISEVAVIGRQAG